VAKKRQHFGWRDVDITGVRSPPLRGVDDPRRDGLPEKGPGIARKGGFLGGTRSVRPRGKAGRKPGHFMITDGRTKGWWPKRDNISVGRDVGGRFSRRDALCASANTGGMQARVWHDHREVSAGRALSGDTPRLRPGRFYGRAEPAPSGERPRGCFRLLTGEQGFRPRQTKGPSGSRLLLEEGNLMGAGLNETSFKGPFGGRCEEPGRVPSRLPLP
jgi:hypothetical protein